MRAALRFRPLRFALVGVLGFLVDAGVLQLLVFHGHVNLYVAKALSFVAAVFSTWLINRTATFESSAQSTRGLLREWLRYLLSSIAGGTANYAAFVLAVQLWPSARHMPVLGVALGSLAGMSVNYLLYSGFVFAPRAQERAVIRPNGRD
jgi:putative flippase GtrA